MYFPRPQYLWLETLGKIQVLSFLIQYHGAIRTSCWYVTSLTIGQAAHRHEPIQIRYLVNHKNKAIHNYSKYFQGWSFKYVVSAKPVLRWGEAAFYVSYAFSFCYWLLEGFRQWTAD